MGGWNVFIVPEGRISERQIIEFVDRLLESGKDRV
jgi:hypothetical protein